MASARSLALPLLILCALGPACLFLPSTPCSIDSDCPSGQRCELGFCAAGQPPADAGPADPPRKADGGRSDAGPDRTDAGVAALDAGPDPGDAGPLDLDGGVVLPFTAEADGVFQVRGTSHQLGVFSGSGALGVAAGVDAHFVHEGPAWLTSSDALVVQGGARLSLDDDKWNMGGVSLAEAGALFVGPPADLTAAVAAGATLGGTITVEGEATLHLPEVDLASLEVGGSGSVFVETENTRLREVHLLDQGELHLEGLGVALDEVPQLAEDALVEVVLEEGRSALFPAPPVSGLLRVTQGRATFLAGAGNEALPAVEVQPAGEIWLAGPAPLAQLAIFNWTPNQGVSIGVTNAAGSQGELTIPPGGALASVPTGADPVLMLEDGTLIEGEEDFLANRIQLGVQQTVTVQGDDNLVVGDLECRGTIRFQGPVGSRLTVDNGNGNEGQLVLGAPCTVELRAEGEDLHDALSAEELFLENVLGAVPTLTLTGADLEPGDVLTAVLAADDASALTGSFPDVEVLAPEGLAACLEANEGALDLRLIDEDESCEDN